MRKAIELSSAFVCNFHDPRHVRNVLEALGKVNITRNLVCEPTHICSDADEGELCTRSIRNAVRVVYNDVFGVGCVNLVVKNARGAAREE